MLITRKKPIEEHVESKKTRSCVSPTACQVGLDTNWMNSTNEQEGLASCCIFLDNGKRFGFHFLRGYRLIITTFNTPIYSR
jgi:hypothetical protein